MISCFYRIRAGSGGRYVEDQVRDDVEQAAAQADRDPVIALGQDLGIGGSAQRRWWSISLVVAAALALVVGGSSIDRIAFHELGYTR